MMPQARGREMQVGTSYFVSHAAAVRYYRDYESDPVRAVETKLREGSIHIGRPTLKPGQKLFLIDSHTRYAIEDVPQVAPSRADYMAKRCTFEDFYRAVNATAGLKIRNADLLARVKRALVNGDQHLNTIPLVTWDVMAIGHESQIRDALRQHGDFYSLAGGVCCLKQAARDAVQVA
jgi:hypothetical protein